MKKYNKLFNVLLGILFTWVLFSNWSGRDYAMYAIITGIIVNATIIRIPSVRENYTGEMVLKITRARFGWLMITIAILLLVLEQLSSRKYTMSDYLGYIVSLYVICDVFVYFFNRRYNPVLFAINGNLLKYTLKPHKSYDATALIQVSKRIVLFERIYVLTFEYDPEIEFDSRQFRKEDLKNFLEVLIQKSRFAVDVNPEIQQHFNLDVSADGIRKPRPGIYGRFADEPFDLADFDAISVRWREAGMAYSDAVKLVMEKTGMLMGDARNTVEASAGWNR